MIALLGGIYDGKYATVKDLLPGSILHVTAGKDSETYRVGRDGTAVVVDPNAGKIDVAIKPQYICPQHTGFLAGGTSLPPGRIR